MENINHFILLRDTARTKINSETMT